MCYKEVLEILAPCGLNCKKCMAFYEGEIKQHSSKLIELLGNFNGYAKKFSEMNPIFKNYPQFQELLEYFSKGSCKGCRNGECINKGCNVINCYKEKGVDFCFKCKEFPCKNTGFNNNLKERWLAMNNSMRQMGVIEYFNEAKDHPRYR